MSNLDIFAAGAIAAFTVDLLVYPLDTIKTRLQSPGHRHLPLYRGGLYQGLGPVIVATIPSSGIFFATYEGVRSHHHHLFPRESHLANAIASSIAEACSCAVLAPAEVVKQNAQVIQQQQQRRGRQGLASASAKAFNAIGNKRDLWTGYFSLVGRNLPYTALQFPLFEALKRAWCVQGASSVAGTAVWAGVAAGVSGAAAAVVTTPVDVVKTRVMLGAGGRKGLTAREVVREVLREEGFRGLWRGVALRAVWTMVGSGLYLGIYEGSKAWLLKRRREENMEAGEGEVP